MFTIVGKVITNTSDYIKGRGKMLWNPKFIVLHNTSEPDISQRPNGFTSQHMENLREFYAGKGWSGGPHFFVDQNGVWAFNPIEVKGVHSPSWNNEAIGIEMLGEYDSDSFSDGDGLKIKNHTLHLIADLSTYFNFSADSLKFHYEDPKTTHKNCPGKNVVKSNVISMVKDLMSQKTTIIFHRKNGETATITGLLTNSRNYADAKDLVKASGMATNAVGLIPVSDYLSTFYSLTWSTSKLTLYCVEN